jgi:hypothetical protein
MMTNSAPALAVPKCVIISMECKKKQLTCPCCPSQPAALGSKEEEFEDYSFFVGAIGEDKPVRIEADKHKVSPEGSPGEKKADRFFLAADEAGSD